MTEVFPSTLPEMLRFSAKRYPLRICLQMWDRDQIRERLTFCEFLMKVEERAKELNAKPGERIALISPNSVEWVIAFFAILFCQGTAVLIDAQLDGDELFSFIQKMDLRAILATRPVYQRIPYEKRSNLPRFLDIENNHTPLHIGEKANEDSQERDPSIALICFTSGSTGDPKGIMLDHRALLTALKSGVYINLSPRDRFLTVLPLSHIYCLCTVLLSSLGRGSSLTLANELKSETILHALQVTRATLFVVVPRILEIFYLKILQKMEQRPLWMQTLTRALMALSFWVRFHTGFNIGRFFFSTCHRAFGGKLRLFYCGGAPLDEDVWRGMVRLGFSILIGYGLSETASALTINDRYTIGTCGRVFDWMQAKIDAPIRGREGEICVRGEGLFRGYFKHPIATANALKDGWFHTGDLGYLDEQQELIITGRVKELIIFPSGQKAIPEEIDRYYANIDGIEEFVSFGVPLSTDSKAEAVHAALVLCSSLQDAGSPQTLLQKAEALIRERSLSVPSHLRVSFVHVVDRIPKTRTFKIKRLELREQYRPVETAPEKAARIWDREKWQWLQSASQNERIEFLGECIEAIIRDLLKLPRHPPLDRSKNFFQFGLDSLFAIELMSRLQEGIKEKISSTAVFEHPNIDSLARYLNHVLNKYQLICTRKIRNC